MAEVQHVLVPRLGEADAAAGAEDPLRVRAGQVGVQVDHLGLDPEAELHAEPA